MTACGRYFVPKGSKMAPAPEEDPGAVRHEEMFEKKQKDRRYSADSGYRKNEAYNRWVPSLTQHVTEPAACLSTLTCPTPEAGRLPIPAH